MVDTAFDNQYVDEDFCENYAKACGIGRHVVGGRADDISMGTTIVAMHYRDGVILAADSRTSSGPIVANRVARKITRILPNVFMLRSGAAADSQMVSLIVRYHAQALRLQLRKAGRRKAEDNENDSDVMQVDCEMSTEDEYSYQYDDSVLGPPVKALAHVMHNMVHEYRDRLSCGVILAGYDLESGPEIYDIPLGGTLIKIKDFAASGSGSGFICAYLRNNYEPNMTREKCLNLLKNAIAYAIEFDNASGGFMRAVAVSKFNVSEFCFTF
ncbi:glutamine phosphoribosylpyrophosphate [Babesia gibsoni]|uniref:Proteasome subunit beta n=1 Tax=Babesia gibsoni TaxID=33632 RepID=A0AAD8PE08_BABGI|nr:glutamine phosphoribosylpyrophosphate [Babesia gibsoni]